MQQPGPQYPNDKRTDPSGFLGRARFHQSQFRAEALDLPYDTYGNYLKKEDGESGMNFYDGYKIFNAVTEYRKYNKQLYSNMLRSEHIPFNFFVPLDKDRNYCKNVFADILKLNILSIDRIEIEYAPSPKEIFLNDSTSFDAYLEYTNADNEKGMIGIEVKYTEREYRLLANSKQAKDIANKESRYYEVTSESQLYKPGAIEVLTSDKFRQIWRNHILGESMLLASDGEFKYFTSLTLFPSDNFHFVETSKEYIDLLDSNDNKFIALTYERFFKLLNKHFPDYEYKDWIYYLTKRYIVKEV